MGSKVDWEEATKMLLAGETFTEIAQHFCVCRQTIHYHFTYPSTHRNAPQKEHSIIYPGIAKWFYANGMTYMKLGKIVFPDSGCVGSANRIRGYLIGEKTHFTIELIRRLSEVTGMTFEEMFGKNEE